MAYGDWIGKDARVWVASEWNPHHGETGYVVDRTRTGIVVHLSSDPDHVDRAFSAWDLEDITPYPEGDPEGERLQEIGKGVIDDLLRARGEGERMSHTPGAWEVRLDSRVGSQHDTYSVHTPGGRVIAAVRDGFGEEEANARLIAASPTMYDYLCELAEAGDERAQAITRGINATA